MKSINFAVGTHTGLVRELNEDNYCAAPEIGLWIVADGMGGHDAGEVASAIAVREIVECIRQGSPLADAIESAHAAIRRAEQQQGTSSHMGSTVVAAKLAGRSYDIAWVGDSRAYVWDGALHQLTTDHSYVQLLLKAGMITEDEMANHPSSNIISQGLGVGRLNSTEIQVDSISGELAETDLLLLCSDGLNGEITDECIAAIISEDATLQNRVDRLIEAALQAGGNDNITVILMG